MAVAGLRLKVSGNSIATVATGADARQHADQGAEEDADEAVEQVLQRDRDAEAEGEVGQDVHAASPQRLGHSGNGRPSSRTKTPTREGGQEDRKRHAIPKSAGPGSANPPTTISAIVREHESERLQQQRKHHDAGEDHQHRPHDAAWETPRRRG